MHNPIVRWWVVFWIVMASVITTLIAGLGSFIVASDSTHLSWLILALFFGASMHLGYKVRARGAVADFEATMYCIETCTSLGLLGTIIGLIRMIVGAFADLNVSSSASVKAALVAMSSGIGTALVTTLIGICCAILLRLQVEVVRMKWGA